MATAMDPAALNAFIETEFPQVKGEFIVREVTQDGVIVEMPVQESHLRPGGTISGPTMFALADVAIYFAILSRLGPVALAVTTNANIDFMRKPEAGKKLIATGRILKLGRVLAVGDVLIQSEGRDEPVARASLTYSIPPKA